MGNSFTIYTGNNQFTITTTSDIYAFAIVGLSSQITYTMNDNWYDSGEGYHDSAYNYIFLYKPGGTSTAETFPSPGSFVFTLNSGSIPADTEIHWVNGTTKNHDGDILSNPPFPAVTYNIEYSSTDAGSGGGDPHIVPLFNPHNKVYVLPTNNHICKYFDNRDPIERIVVNTKMWVLDNKFIYTVEWLKEKNSIYYNSAKDKVDQFIVDDCHTDIDTSFARYISFMVKTQEYCDKIVFDVENLLPVDIYTETDAKIKAQINDYSLKHMDVLDVSNTLKLQKIKVSDIMPYKKNIINVDKIISRETDDDVYYRQITIDSRKHGLLTFDLIRIPSKNNHRNHIEIRVCEPIRLNQYNCCGTLINIDQTEYVPSLFHLNEDINKIHCYALFNNTLNESRILTTKEWRLRRSQIVTAERHKCKKQIRRTGHGEMDFYSNASANPEKEYLKMMSHLKKN